jgi:hypothetical protein
MQKRMGARIRGDGRKPGVRGRARRILPLLIALAPLLTTTAAQASFHLMKVREVYPGASNDSYVVLQMLFAGENAVGNHSLRLYDVNGATIDTFTFSPGYFAPNGSHGNNTILIGDTGVAGSFGVTPDDHTQAGFNIPAAAGAVCWLDGSPPDCVSWGSFAGTLPNPAGTPASAGGVTAGKALRRSIASGCATYLESTDDTNNSATDFSEQNPVPRNNAAAPSETLCPALPNTTIGEKPLNPTNNTGASFTFTASPASGASFECKLDAEPGFTACSSPKTYSNLSEAMHSFEVRAVNAAGPDPTPAKYEWRVDLTPPAATITASPPDPSAGSSASFKYESNELGPLAGSPFECRLTPLEANFSSCAATGKTYLSLANGDYVFEVRAKDRAGNLGSADSFEWEVDNSLADMTPPQTTIDSKPPDPSDSASASFGYSSNEPGSTFECSLDAGPFGGCPATGITYGGLGSGAHSFQVRAIDASANVDPTPAGYSFTVALASQPVFAGSAAPTAAPRVALNTLFTVKPPGRTRDRTPTIRFRATSPGATFQCKLDNAPFKACRSPFTTKKLTYGKHVLLVRATTNGSVDPTPAAIRFRVAKP